MALNVAALNLVLHAWMFMVCEQAEQCDHGRGEQATTGSCPVQLNPKFTKSVAGGIAHQAITLLHLRRYRGAKVVPEEDRDYISDDDSDDSDTNKYSDDDETSANESKANSSTKGDRSNESESNASKANSSTKGDRSNESETNTTNRQPTSNTTNATENATNGTTCITGTPHSAGMSFANLSPGGTPCVFGTDQRDEGWHCMMDAGKFGSLGWCWTSASHSSWGPCSESCPLFGQVGVLGKKVDALEEILRRLSKQVASGSSPGEKGSNQSKRNNATKERSDHDATNHNATNKNESTKENKSRMHMMEMGQ